MDAKTSAALEASIKHWERNVAAETDDDASVMSDDCALCDQFFLHDCIGCPVMEKTGRKYCRTSPYDSASAALLDWIGDDAEAKATWRIAAQAELDFLISLREP